MRKILFFTFFIFSNAIFSQDLLTFNDCLNLALKNNLEIKSAENSEKTALYQYKSSYGKLVPSVYANAENRNSWGREVNPNTNLFTNTDVKYFTGNLNAAFNLFAGFEAINTIKYTKQEHEINKIKIQDVQNGITLDLAQKFITILYLQEIIASNKEEINSSDKQLELALLKFNSGVIAESEVFKLKSQKAIEELNLLTNENRLSDNYISIKQLMNIPLEKEIRLIKPNLVLDKNLDLQEDQYSLTNKAVEINPLYTMSILKEKKARTSLSIARAALYPVLSVRAFYATNFTRDPLLDPINFQVDDNFSRSIRFNLSIPIFNQLETYSKIKTKKMDYKQSKIDTEIVKNKLSKQVLKAITDTKTAIKKNESSTIAYEFAQKSYEADELKFQLGKININELNNTKMMYNNSLAELIQSKYELLFNNALIKFYLGEIFTL